MFQLRSTRWARGLIATAVALALAVMHVLFREGLADRAYLAKYTDDPAGLEAHLGAGARVRPLQAHLGRQVEDEGQVRLGRADDGGVREDGW